MRWRRRKRRRRGILDACERGTLLGTTRKVKLWGT